MFPVTPQRRHLQQWRKIGQLDELICLLGRKRGFVREVAKEFV